MTARDRQQVWIAVWIGGACLVSVALALHGMATGQVDQERVLTGGGWSPGWLAIGIVLTIFASPWIAGCALVANKYLVEIRLRWALPRLLTTLWGTAWLSGYVAQFRSFVITAAVGWVALILIRRMAPDDQRLHGEPVEGLDAGA